MIHERTTDPGL